MLKKLMLLTALLVSLSSHAYQIPTGPGNKYSDTVVLVNPTGTPTNNVASYSAVVQDITPTALATDFFVLRGSATKVVKVTRVQISAGATAQSLLDFYCFIRTTANTGGASVALPVAKFDQNNATATASATYYTSNPTALGTGTLMAADHYLMPALNASGFALPPWSEDFGIRNDQPVVLRGVNQSFVVSLNGQTLPSGLNMYVTVFWTEE